MLARQLLCSSLAVYEIVVHKNNNYNNNINFPLYNTV